MLSFMYLLCYDFLMVQIKRPNNSTLEYRTNILENKEVGKLGILLTNNNYGLFKYCIFVYNITNLATARYVRIY